MTTLTIGTNELFPASPYGVRCNIFDNLTTSSQLGQTDNSYLGTFVDDISASNWRTDLMDDAIRMFLDKSSKNWDGYDAMPIKKNAVTNVINLIVSLQPGIIPPNVVPQPAGEFSLDWIVGKDKSFSMYFDGEFITYASLIGNEKSYGKVPVYNGVPFEIKELLSRYFYLSK